MPEEPPPPPSPQAIFNLASNFAKILQTAITRAYVRANQRPAHPAINTPLAGAVIAASQTVVTPVIVQISTNRPDKTYAIDLIDATTFLDVHVDQPVTFSTNPPSAVVNIPNQPGTDPVTYMIQCRVIDDHAGNTHRILIDAVAPALPAPPVITPPLTARDNAANPINSPADRAVNPPDLTNAFIHATVSGGTTPYTFEWKIIRSPHAPSPVTSPHTANDLPINLLDLGPPPAPAQFDVIILCQVRDSIGMLSAQVGLTIHIQ